MATLYAPVVFELNLRIRTLAKELGAETLDMLKEHDLADENYVKWEANGGEEKVLSAFKLTNRQMFWLSMAHYNTVKYINTTDISVFAWRFRSDYLNVLFKNSERFRDAFDCAPMTETEAAVFEEYRIRSTK